MEIKKVKSANDNYLMFGLTTFSFGIILVITMAISIFREVNYFIFSMLSFCLCVGCVLTVVGVIFISAYKRRDEFNLYLLQEEDYNKFCELESCKDYKLVEQEKNIMYFINKNDYLLCSDYKLFHLLKEII